MLHLRTILNFVYRNFCFIGIDFLRPILVVKGLPLFLKQFFVLRRQADHSFPLSLFQIKPMLSDWTKGAGVISGHYFHQDLYVSRRIFKNSPARHIDIGSRIDGFVAHVASFREIEIFDIRSIQSTVSNIKYTRGDLMDEGFGLSDCCDSVSSLHAIEHFGLGRYGDPVNYNGHLLALKNIHKMLINGGTFYFSVPIGKQRILFNAHRVFGLRYLLNLFRGAYSLKSFSFVDDDGRFHADIKLDDDLIDSNCGCEYGCGIFEWVKIS